MYLLAISIGPVQEFIASARRSRDLWFGSWLLSELSKAAAKKIADDCGGKDKLIFPAIFKNEDLEPVIYQGATQKSGTDFNVVNKILAVVDGDEARVKTLCQETDKAMKERLRTLSKEAFSRIQPEDPTHFHRKVAEKQLADLVEFYWSALPLGDNYSKARDDAESLLASRKATRDFTKVSWHFDENIAHAPKSSLDGQRESVIDEDAFSLGKDELYKQFGVREGERLCGVGLFKRHGNREGDDSFFSTSHVAALPLLESVNDTKYAEAFEEYIKKLKDCGLKKQNGLNFVPLFPNTSQHKAFKRFDGHLLFKERLSEYIQDEAKLEDARRALSKLLKCDLNVKEPFPYYALLLADGDHMGKAIDAQAKKTNDAEGHKNLSAKLSAFAQSVRGIVQVEHKGSLVYAGGDDVLAFVPLHRVLSCSQDLASRFKTCMEKFPTEDGTQPTLSVGIAVVHHLDPLSDALDLARGSEKAAKEAGRNALAVTVSKRSGADLTVKGHWGEIDVRLQSFTQLHVAGAIPDGAAYELRELSRDLSKLPDSIRVQAITIEALRILRRKRVTAPPSLNEAEREKFRESVKNAFKDIEMHIQSPNLSLEDLANELIAARTFASTMKQAKVTDKEILQPSEPKKKDAK